MAGDLCPILGLTYHTSHPTDARDVILRENYRWLGEQTGAGGAPTLVSINSASVMNVCFIDSIF